MQPDRIGYVLKVYPRFSETFVLTEILAREAQGEQLAIFALRPTTDQRFHPELARVQAPVTWVPRPTRLSDAWTRIAPVLAADAAMAARFAQLVPQLEGLPGDEVVQAVLTAAAVREQGVTHLHAHFASLAGRIAYLASHLADVPFTITTHAKDIYHESVDPVWLRRICGAAEHVIAISRFNEDHLTRVLDGTGARIVQQYNALELDRFPYRDPETTVEGTLRIASVGRLVPKKGFDHLIDTTARLVDGGIPVSVRIAGAGEQEAELRAQIARLGLDEVVELMGPRTQSEIQDLVRWAHVFAAPCVPGDDGNIDGLPTVVLEAMAIGTPVVGTDVTGLPEVLRHEPAPTGQLVPAGDDAALEAALLAHRDGTLDRVAVARNARALIEAEFDSRRQAAALAALRAAPLQTRPTDEPAVRSAA